MAKRERKRLQLVQKKKKKEKYQKKPLLDCHVLPAGTLLFLRKVSLSLCPMADFLLASWWTA